MPVLRWIDHNLERVILFILLLIMTVVIVLQVFMRYVVESSLTWSEELARFCFVWLIYIGISYGVKKAKHIRVEALLSVFKRRGKYVINMIAYLLFLFFALFAVYYGFSIYQVIKDTGQVAPSIRISMSIMYLGMPVGMLLTSFRLIQRIYIETKTYRADEEVIDNDIPRL
ncbi:TRAP transporter small permease [Sporosarcina aquimarina]|uniref:TRAP transporter small permease n=1 Tax=Sporosarcina aquimarina TaxID=114975 RepID=UPI001C8F0ADF|nr:TRAP transporter small permease [Sporosarcina aquimarina]MBY0223168.1 TRAP transporter small permease [Sporosarcina aquimarina]